MARIAAGVTAVMLAMTLVTAVMLSAVPSHVRARIAPLPIHHVENCRPFDQWLAEARRDLDHGRPHNALHDTSLSRRDCSYDAERDRIEALAYHEIGDRFSAIAAAVRFADAEPGDRAQELLDFVQHF